MTFYIVLNQYREAEKAFAAVAHYGATLPPLHIVALKYAVANGPCDMSRAFASEDAVTAYYYAREVDKGPHDVTREGACRDAEWAYWYACEVDESPHDVTRKGACKKDKYAYWYARDVDKCPRDDTRRGASRNWYWKNYYKISFPANDP